MYNANLNSAEIENFRNYVAGKRIVLVGNSASMFSDPNHGEYIDAHDVVIRMGKGVPYVRYKEYLGTKTHVWFFGTSRAGMYQAFIRAPYKIMTGSQIALYRENEDNLLFSKELMNGNLEIYQDFFLTGDTNYLLDMTREIHGKIEPEIRLSQGVQALHFLVNKVCTYKSIDLIGFDFFASDFEYTYNTDKRNIPRSHPTTSWHMPLVSKSYAGNPHIHDNAEEAYIRSLSDQGVNIYEMPKELNMAKLAEVLKDLRGSQAQIKENYNG